MNDFYFMVLNILFLNNSSRANFSHAQDTNKIIRVYKTILTYLGNIFLYIISNLFLFYLSVYKFFLHYCKILEKLLYSAAA